MAFNAKNKDKITAVKGLDSSAVYTQQDQKKRLEAAAEAGRKARQAAVEKLKKQNRESREANDKAKKQAVAQSNANRAKTASIEERVDQKRQITDAMTKTREWGAGKGDKWQSQGDFQTAYNAYENAVNWAEQAEAAGDAATAKYMREAASYLAKWGNAAGSELAKITNQYGSFDNAVDYRSGDKSGYREYLNRDKTWDEINRHITELKRTIDTTSDLKRRAEYMDELSWYEDYARNNYTEAAQGELEQLQRRRNTLQSALAQADINNSPLTGTPVGDRQRAETLRRFDEDIAAAKAGNMDAWYISALEKAREQFLADEAPVSYEQNWQDIDRYDELSGRVEGMNAQIAEAEKTLKKAKDSEYERENRIKYAALEQEMNAADWYFDQYDYEDFKQLVAREKNSAATMGMPDIYTVDVRDQYTKDEASIYMYLREKGRAAEADAYANYMQSTAAARRNQQIGQRLAAEDIGIIGRTIGSVAANPGKIANTIDINLQKLANALSDDYVPIDYETTANFGVASNVNRELATQELNALGTLSDLIGRDIPYIGSYTLGDLYGTGVDYLNSAMNAVLFGTSGAGAALAAEKFSDEYRAAKERGGSDNEAFNYAWGSSIAEGVGEQIVLDRYLGFLTKLGKRPGKAAAVIAGLFSMAEGGVQEAATTVMENAIDKWTMGDNSEYSRAVKRYEAMGYERGTAEQMAIDDMNREILKSGIMGAIGQGAPVAIGGAAYGISDAIEDAGATRALGKDIIGQGNAAGMAQLIGEVSGKQTKARTGAGAVGRQYTKFAQNAQKYVEAADESVRGVIKEKADRVMMAPVMALDGTSQATKEKASKRTAAMRKSDEGASVGGESVTVQGFVKTADKSGDARLNIKKADGTLAEANMEDVTFDTRTAEVYSYAADMATPELANMFRLSIQPDQMAGIERVANGYSQAYDMAKAGFKEASVRASSLTDALTDEQVSVAYKLGADARSAGQMQAITAARQRAEANMGKVWKGGKATFDSSVVVAALDDEQKNQIDMASVVTGAMGVNVVFFESKADEAGRYTRENGSYNRKTNTIYIDVNAGRNYKGDSMTKTALLRTLSHEVTHAIQRNSPEIYAELRDTVTDILGDAKGATIEDLIDRKLAQDGSLTTRDAAMDELVADACEKMLEDSDAAQRLAEAHPEAAKTFFPKVGELLTKLKEAIKAAFKGRQLSTEAQLAMKDVERYQKMVDLWTKGVMQTAEVSGRELDETTDSEMENAAISEETAAEGEDITFEELVGEYGEPARPAETHIDNRTWENVGDRGVKAFQNEYKYARMYMGPAAKTLLADANASLPGERYRTADGEWSGQQRQTTEVLAELKDRGGWSWEQLKAALGVMADRYDVGDLEREIPDTAIIKRIEIVLDEILTEGYDAMEGAHIVPDAGYVAYKNKLPGAAEYSNVVQDEGITFEDYTQFQTRTLADGTTYVAIDAADIGTSETTADDSLAKRTRFYMRERFRGTVLPLGKTKSAYIRSEAINEYTNPAATITTEAYNSKMMAATELHNLLKASTFVRWNPDDGRHKDAVRGWNTWLSRFAVYDNASRDIQVFEGEVKIKRIARGDVFYDITKIKNITDGIMGQSIKADAQSISDKFSIAQANTDVNSDIQKQTREEAISTRFVLANMLEADAVSGEEVAWLRGYKNQFAKLEQLLGAIDQNKKIIRELMFKKGRTDAESVELQKARERNKILQEQVARMDEGLLKLEKADVIRSLVAREEQKIRDKEAEKRREGIAKVRENQRNTAIRKNIQRRAKRLDRMLRQPSDKEHIPEGLRGAMLDMMEIFAGSEAAFGGAKAERERLYRAQREYEAMRGDEDNADLASRYDEDTADRLRQLADLMKDRKISDFDNAELTQLSMVIEHFEHLVRDQNEAFADSRRKKTEGYAEQIWQQTMTMKGRKENAITGSALVKAIKHLGHANVIPPYFYKHLGGAMGKLGNDLLKAEGRYGVNMNKAAKRLDEIRRKYEHDKWVTKKDDILKLETEIGDTLELTREQALGIWASAKRERLNTVQRAAHLRDGGVILEKPARKLGRKGQEINVTPTKISQRDIQQIDKWLTDQQKAYADEMVGYISRDMAALGNETSMELAGYKKFGEGYYYPYKTSSDFRRTELGKVEDALIKNMGFTKSVTRNAKTPVVITDFSATVADHVNAMIMYNAFAVAQDQMMRVYDFKLDDSNSVKNLLRNAFGDEIPAYIEQHMRDLYGGVSPDRDAGLINWTIGAHKKQAVLGSASVVVQQPTALIRAMSQINPKYFMGQRVEGGFNEAMDYAGTAVIKDIGGFDSGVGRGATDWLNGKPKDWQNHAIKSGLDTVSDWAGLGAEYADKLAWTAIWKAVKREQADKYKVDINSPELKEIAGERFDEVVRLTQVYDSVMTRSQLMRNKNLFWKMATSFMSEPTVTWNMLYDAGIEAFKNKKMGAAIGITASVLVSVILTNLAKAVVTAARDDDDEEATYLERYVKNAAEGLINDVVPFNYMPIVRDIYSKLQGYEVERADMGIINDMLAAGEVMLDEDKAPIAKVKSLVTLVSIMTGLPAKNIWRDVEAVFNTVGATPQSEARPGWLENALRTGAIDATPIGKWFDLTDSKANNADRLYEAILDGDMARAEELREHLKVYNNADDDKAVDGLLRNRIKEGYEEGEITKTEAVDMLTKHAGLKKYDAEKRVSQWSYGVETGTEYSDLKDAYLEGEITKTEAIRARAEYGGSDDDDAQATVAKWEYELNTGMAYDDMKDAYIAGDITRAEAINARVKYGGADKIDAEKTLQQWEYEKKSGIPYADMKDAFIAGELTENQAISARMQYGGAREAEALQTVAEWQYEKDTGRNWSDMKVDYIAGRINAKDVTNAQVKYAGAFEKDVKAQILKWDYEKDTGIAYNDMKGAYIEGDITAKEAVAARIKYGGMEAEDAELDVSKWDFEIDYGYDYNDMSDYYELGKISKSEAIAARVKYGKSEKDDAYFAVTGWQYEMDTGKEWEGKFTKVHDAVESRNASAMQTAIKEVYDNSAYTDGKKAASALTSNITSTYKPMYIKASATERAAMEEMLLDAYQYAYELAGERYYGDSYKLKQIRKWLEQ